MTDDNQSSAEKGEDRGRHCVSDSHSRFCIAWDELKGVIGNEERHKRLHGRLIGLLTASLVLDLVIAISLAYVDSFSDKQGNSFGRAFAWTSDLCLLMRSLSRARSSPYSRVRALGSCTVRGCPAVTGGLDGELARLQDQSTGGMAPLAASCTSAGLVAPCPSGRSRGI